MLTAPNHNQLAIIWTAEGSPPAEIKDANPEDVEGRQVAFVETLSVTAGEDRHWAMVFNDGGELVPAQSYPNLMGFTAHNQTVKEYVDPLKSKALRGVKAVVDAT